LAEYTHIIVPFVFDKVKDESSVIIFEEKHAPNGKDGDNQLEEHYENVDESVVKIGAEEKGHFAYAVIGQGFDVSLEDHQHQDPKEGKLSYEP
jgi:hypothetical protein